MTAVHHDFGLAPVAAAVVFAKRGPAVAHAGIAYRYDDAGTWRYLHLAGHHRLENDEAAPSRSRWVLPTLDPNEAEDVRTSAALIARCHASGRVPYALAARDARFVADGSLVLGGSLGLTCATFVLCVFRHAGIELIDLVSWDTHRSEPRKAEDLAAQQALVAYLEADDAGAHAAAVKSDVGCTRIRPEEVAAASGLVPRPIAYVPAEEAGRALLQALPPPR